MQKKTTPKLTLAQIMGGRSRFGGPSSNSKEPAKKFVPKTFRVTQHKGGS